MDGPWIWSWMIEGPVAYDVATNRATAVACPGATCLGQQLIVELDEHNRIRPHNTWHDTPCPWAWVRIVIDAETAAWIEQENAARTAAAQNNSGENK